MPELPKEGIEIVSGPFIRKVRQHSQEFKDCLSNKYRECNEKVPFNRMFSDKLRGVPVDEQELNRLHAELEICKSEAYQYCRDTFGW